MSTPLRIGIPSKGRLADIAGGLLNEAGLSFRRQERSLFARVRELPLDVTFLRTDDIPTLCSEGAIAMGITGSDLIAESGAHVNTRLSLNTAHCRLAVCVRQDTAVRTLQDLEGARVATSFPTITRQHFAKSGVAVRLVRLSGSVEVMIALGVAEAIVDLVDTGSTLAANRLRVLEEIGSYELKLIENLDHQNSELSDRVVRRLEGVVIARSYSLLEYNIAEDNLQQAEAITPGFKSPTVGKLEESGWYSVRAMVQRKHVIDVMERLEAIGATAVLETEIKNCRL